MYRLYTEVNDIKVNIVINMYSMYMTYLFNIYIKFLTILSIEVSYVRDT